MVLDNSRRELQFDSVFVFYSALISFLIESLNEEQRNNNWFNNK